MQSTERTQALEIARELARRAGGEVLMPRLRLGRPPAGLEKKGVRDLVTDADRLAEELIVAGVRAAFPGHRIVAEEAVRDELPAGDTGYCWYIDPLDGTTNFVHGLPLFTVSIACYGPEGGEVGVVYAPYLDECYYASRGGGAWCLSGAPRGGALPGGEPVRLSVSGAATLIDSVLVTGFHYELERYPNAHVWAHLLPRTRGLRRLGSAALDLAFVAAGRFDGFWERGLHPFDVAAGCLLIEEAGGCVTDYQGGGDWLWGRNLLATNGRLHELLVGEIVAAG